MDPQDQNGFSIGSPQQGGPQPPSPQGGQQTQPNNNGFSIGAPQQSGQSDNAEIPITEPWYTPAGMAQRGGSLVEGVTQGAASTLSGIDDIVAKHVPGGKFLTTPIGQSPTQENSDKARAAVHDLAGDNNAPGSSNIYNKIGYGGETLAEFMLGDEALKGLSHSEKLGIVSKWMKIAEKSPRLIRAIQTGADMAKVQAELSPEEIQLLQKYPKIAKMVGIGVQATRAGVTQGVQTTVRSGGDVKKGAEDAALTAGTGAVLGTVAHGVAGALRKGGKAAQTVSAMNDVAANAPSSHAVEEGVGNAVNDAFSKETGTLQNNLDATTSAVGMMGEGAPAQSAITTAAQKAAKLGKQSVHDAYQSGLDHLVGLAGDQTIPYEGSPLHKAAQELVESTPEEAGPLDQAFNVSQPGSPKANGILDRLTNLGQAGEDEAGTEASSILDENGQPFQKSNEAEESVPADLNMQHLVARRQTLSNLLRNLGPNDRADRAIYSKLLEGTDDTIAKLADSVEGEGGEEGAEALEGEAPQSPARQHFDQMNAAYREGIRPFQNRDVKNILSGKLNDVSKSIMGGQTSVADIADVKKAVGQANFKNIADASLQNIVQSFMDKDSGELDYKKLFQKFNKLDPNVRTAMFGDSGKALADALKVSVDSANGLSEIGKQVNDLLGSGNIDSLLKDPGRVKQMANLVGPDGMKSIGRSIMENQIKEASTALTKNGEIKTGHFDPDKVIDWWLKLKDSPEVRDALFSVDKDSAKHYNDMMKDLGQAASVKKLVKYGVLPITMGTAGVVHGPGAALFGALAGLGTEAGFGRARDILDSIANNPRTWRALGVAGKAADKASAAVKPAARSTGAAAVFKSLQGTLGGDDSRKGGQDSSPK